LCIACVMLCSKGFEKEQVNQMSDSSTPELAKIFKRNHQDCQFLVISLTVESKDDWYVRSYFKRVTLFYQLSTTSSLLTAVKLFPFISFFYYFTNSKPTWIQSGIIAKDLNVNCPQKCNLSIDSVWIRLYVCVCRCSVGLSKKGFIFLQITLI
jgi:hypothetical protein